MSLTCTAYHQSSFLKGILLLFIFYFSSLNIKAQNLFANPGFEDINTCTEYHAPCAPEAWYYINPTTNYLVNGHKAPRPMNGTNILLVPMLNVFNPNETRPYVYTMLACPLMEGEKYKLSFYINTLERKYFNLDLYFSDKEPATRYFNTKNISPTFSITADNVVAEMKQNWKFIEYYFTATGNEQFCMLGNMSQKINYGIDEKMNASGTIFYFLDEVNLVPVDNKPLCENYNSNIRKMYAQDYRHTDYVLIDSEIIKPRPPVFIQDTITIPAVFFETGSANLKPAFIKKMDSILYILEQKKIARLDIIGHTDNKGKSSDNIVLSLSRAEAVRKYLINKLPQYTDISFASGKGQDQPVADNLTEKGRAKNRRVEIILTCVYQKNNLPAIHE